MSKSSSLPKPIQQIVRFKWSFTSILIVVLISIYLFIKISNAITSLEFGLTPPELPEYHAAEVVNVNPMGWPNKSADWFHHATQGTATIPIPYEWFVALEAPSRNPWLSFFGTQPPFIGEFMLRMGFIKQDSTATNPNALPIGIAQTESIYFEGINRKAVAAGFTCAACHTGQMLYGNKRYIVDGGPATTDLGLFTKSLGAALGQTALASRIGPLDSRFDRFARKVLGSNYNVLTKGKLKAELDNTIKELVKTSDKINVTEGFTRLDALNRIGNQVFRADMDRPANYAPITAPVNFPHIWTTSWFDWVQYDGSIMQPLVRNAGEALGVQAFLDTKGPDDQRFASSANITNLVKLEDWIGGTHPIDNGNKFNGLLAPKWPSDFPQIDKSLADNGAVLYQELCKGCHLPSIKSPEFWTEKYWKPIKYYEEDEPRQTDKPYLKMKIIPLAKIGTDPAQSGVLTSRTVDTTGLNLNTEVCTPVKFENESGAIRRALSYVPLKDSATSNFGLALGAVVARTNEQWFRQNYTPESVQLIYEGARPNCLQVARGYKARPLNGVWATAPFLHNGSIATIYDLLSAPSERPTFVQLGSQRFDTKYLGIVQNDKIKSLNKREEHKSYKATADYDDGLFILDTREPGNNNTGHLFVDRVSGEVTPAGRVGRNLSEDEKMALIEYLKTL